jgi:hypothetical protein
MSDENRGKGNAPMDDGWLALVQVADGLGEVKRPGQDLNRGNASANARFSLEE